MPEKVHITGVIYLPWRRDHQPTAPLAADAHTETITGGKIVLTSGRKVFERDLLKPLGDPKWTPDFYELDALQHGWHADRGDPTPSVAMAEISDVALSTERSWITCAGARRLLPPER